MNERIYMDEFHYESYDNYKEAIDAWSIQTAHAQIAIDSELDLNLGMEGISSIIMFDENRLKEIIGNESIKDQVKNMASRVKSNLTLWIKKFINFFFGWIINFFRGVVNIRKSLKSGYDKSKAYLKKLNEMSSKIGNDFTNKDGEKKTVKVSAAAPALIQSLCVVLTTSYSIGKMVTTLKDTKEGINNSDKDDNNKMIKGEIEVHLNNLQSAIIAMAACAAAVDPRNSTFYGAFKENKYNIVAWLDNKTDSVIEAAKTVLKDESIADLIKTTIARLFKGIKNVGKDASMAEPEIVKKATDRIIAVLGESSKNIDIPEPDEVEYVKAFAIVKEGLSAFMNIAEANRSLWNFEKVAEQVEKIKRKLLVLADKHVNQDEEAGKRLFNRITAVGQLMSAVSKNANKCMSNANKLLDTVITDATRLGAAMTSASGKN